MKTIFSVICCLTLTTSIFAQGKITQPELDTGSIASKFDYVLEKSYAYKDFKMIRKASILTIKAHTTDSLETAHERLLAAKQSLQQNQNTITELQKKAADLEQENEVLFQAKNTVSFFGIALSKALYNTLIWSVIILLLMGSLVLVVRFRKNNRDAKKALSYASRLENDIEALRKKAMLREQELMRKLQDEVNKNV